MVRKKTLLKIIVGASFLFGVLLFYSMEGAIAGEAAPSIKVPEEIIKISKDVGEEFGISPELLQSLMFYESTFRSEAVNGFCEGVAQIDKRFHQGRMRKLGVTDLTDPRQNLRVAADYLKELASKYYCIGIVLMRYNGFRNPEEYVERTGKLSEYADKVLELSAALERTNGK